MGCKVSEVAIINRVLKKIQEGRGFSPAAPKP